MGMYVYPPHRLLFQILSSVPTKREMMRAVRVLLTESLRKIETHEVWPTLAEEFIEREMSEPEEDADIRSRSRSKQLRDTILKARLVHVVLLRNRGHCVEM